jgi:lysophospholipase L1-like esterase
MRYKRLRYILGVTFSLPLVPIMFVQSRIIRARTPRLPDAQGDAGIAFFEESVESVNLLGIGESTIAGVGVDLHVDGLIGRISAELAQSLKKNVHWKVRAKSGYTVGKVLEHIVPTLKNEKADIIIIGLGANNAFKVTPPLRWERKINQLIDELQKIFGEEIPIVFINAPPIRDFPAFSFFLRLTIGNLMHLLSSVLEDIAEKRDRVYYFSDRISLAVWIERLGLKQQAYKLFSDGVHPSAMSYEIWAKEIATYIDGNQKIKQDLDMWLRVTRTVLEEDDN